MLGRVFCSCWLTSSMHVSNYLLVVDGISIFLSDLEGREGLRGVCLLRMWKGCTLPIFCSRFSLMKGLGGMRLSNRRNVLPKIHFIIIVMSQ